MYKIIVPTDFSPTAAGALRYGHFLAEATGYDLEIIHVHDGYGHLEGSRVKKGGMEARMAAQRSIDEFVRFAIPATAAAGDGPETTDVSISSRDVVGSPTTTLLDYTLPLPKTSPLPANAPFWCCMPRTV